MFEARLGLALGKTISEIRRMPAPEYRTFELLYLIEPWGWHNQEYLFGKLMSVIASFSGKTRKGLSPKAKDFMRDDMAGLRNEIEFQQMIESKTPDEIRELKIARVKTIFGIKE